MAKFVVAGRANCPFYARAELLADELQNRLPDLSVHKIKLTDEEWVEFVKSKIEECEWKHDGTSPLVWRELINRGGKGLLVGGCNEFLELAKEYYDVTCAYTSEKLLNIASDNELQLQEELAEREALQESFSPFSVTLTGAASSLAYSFIPNLFTGDIFKDYVSLKMLDRKDKLGILESYRMEIQDCVFPCLQELDVVHDPKGAFKNTDLVVILNEITADGSQEFTKFDKEALLRLKDIAHCIANEATPSAKIIVCNSHSALTCTLMSKWEPRLDIKRIFAIARHKENAVKSVIAKQLKVKTSDIKSVTIWGSLQCSSSEIVDVSQVRAIGCDNAIWAPHITAFSMPLKDAVLNNKWIDDELKINLQKRNNQHTNIRSIKTSSAITSQIRDILHGQQSMAETSSVGVALKDIDTFKEIGSDLFASLPVKFLGNGEIEIQNLLPNDMKLLQEILANLKQESERVIELVETAVV